MAELRPLVSDMDEQLLTELIKNGIFNPLPNSNNSSKSYIVVESYNRYYQALSDADFRAYLQAFSPELQSEVKQAYLGFFAYYGHQDLCAWLLSEGADPGLYLSDGDPVYSPLELALIAWDTDLADYFLKHGAQFSVQRPTFWITAALNKFEFAPAEKRQAFLSYLFQLQQHNTLQFSTKNWGEIFVQYLKHESNLNLKTIQRFLDSGLDPNLAIFGSRDGTVVDLLLKQDMGDVLKIDILDLFLDSGADLSLLERSYLNTHLTPMVAEHLAKVYQEQLSPNQRDLFWNNEVNSYFDLKAGCRSRLEPLLEQGFHFSTQSSILIQAAQRGCSLDDLHWLQSQGANPQALDSEYTLLTAILHSFDKDSSEEDINAKLSFALKEAPLPDELRHEAAVLMNGLLDHLSVEQVNYWGHEFLKVYPLVPTRFQASVLFRLCFRLRKADEQERLHLNSLIGDLLASGYPANGIDSEGLTPLMVAASAGDTEAVTQLLTYGADINAINKPHAHPRFGLNYFLTDDIGGSEEFNQSVLAFAVGSGDHNTVRYLWEQGCSISPPYHQYFLMPAVTNADLEMLQFVLELIPEEHHAMILPDALLQASRLPNSQDPTQVLPLLLLSRPSLNPTDENLIPPLLIYIQRKYYDAMELILEAGADPQLVYFGKTAMDYAAKDPKAQAILRAALK